MWFCVHRVVIRPVLSESMVSDIANMIGHWRVMDPYGDVFLIKGRPTVTSALCGTSFHVKGQWERLRTRETNQDLKKKKTVLKRSVANIRHVLARCLYVWVWCEYLWVCVRLTVVLYFCSINIFSPSVIVILPSSKCSQLWPVWQTRLD